MMLKEAIGIVPDLNELVLYLREGRLSAEGRITETDDFVAIPPSAWKWNYVAQQQGHLMFDKADGSLSHWEDVRMSRTKFRQIYPEKTL